MSMIGYAWDIEENVEEALVAYIKNNVTDVAMVIPARTAMTAAYPLVVVEAKESNNHTDTGRFTGRRQMSVDVHIVTEVLNYNAGTNDPARLRTAREHHRIIKASVLGALAGNTVHDDLNALQPAGVAFSQCHMEEQTRTSEDGKFITSQTLNIIAQPEAI
jgi:hypothetical protein